MTAWPEPYGFDATPQEEKDRKLFSFDADGIAQGVDWLNEQYKTQEERWKRADGGWR